MKKYLKNIFSVFTISILGLGLVAALSTPQAQADNIADGICRGILSADGQTVTDEVDAARCQEDGNESFSFLVRRVINVLSIVVGAVSVIMIIIGGFRYIISGGDSAGVSAAKNTILYAIVGLVIVLFAQVIIRFVYSNANPSTSSGPGASSSSQQ